MAFRNLNLHPLLLKALEESGYTVPTAIQEQVIPEILKGLDVRASAQTGTGKTAAFLLPALHNLMAAEGKAPYKGPRVLVLAPTRELAMQIATQAEKYSQFSEKLKTVCISGGVPYAIQLKKLSRPYDILIATPGRLIDFLERGKINLSAIRMLILDEADRMLDMGFIEPVEQISSATPATRQTLLFSATLGRNIIQLSEKLLKEPIIEVAAAAEQAKHENITQKLHYVDDLSHKHRLLEHILAEKEDEQTIIFTSTKKHADELAMELQDKGHSTASLHGDMSQRERTRTIKELRNGRIRVLVATDVAARGIDIQSITQVINFDLPRDVEDYVHRIGRTGRAGAQGTAFSFAGQRDAFLVKKIEKFTGQQINVAVIEGLEPKTSIRHDRNPRQQQGFRKDFGRPRFGRKPSSESGRSFSDKPFSGNREFGRRDADKPFSGNKEFGRRDGDKPFSGNKEFGRRDSNKSFGSKDFTRKDYSPKRGGFRKKPQE